MNNEKLPWLREKARRLPLEPGVYLMRDASGHIIYVGKAKALRNRVSSYFRSVDKHHPKVYRMVENADDFSTIVTGSEFEALVLECSLIKQHLPRYNILLKDDKGYHYIRVSGEAYPRITSSFHRAEEDGGRYIGPYTSSFVVTNTVDEVNKAFLLPVCRRRFPEDFRKGRPCLNYHIKQCMGVCMGKIGQAQYAEVIDNVIAFLQGGSDESIRLLTERMEQAAEKLDFEKAAGYRDRIRAIRRIADRQNVVFAKVPNMDAVALVQAGQESCAAVLRFREKRLVDKQDFLLGELSSGLEAARSEFILSYYGGRQDIPGQISFDGPVEDEALVAQYLSQQAGYKVALHVPVRGNRRQLVQMASVNAAQTLAHIARRSGRELAALDELARLLGLPQPPAYIEAYDISNYGAQTVVGGMVVFEDGRPKKDAYKKFNIKTVEGTDDYASMREILGRRFGRYFEEGESGAGFGRLPDLILLDGGKGHVAAVEPLLAEMGVCVPLFGMVKDDKHRTRAIAHDGGEIAINSSKSAFALVTKIQEEVHRFSIAAMKKKHRKSAFALRITSVPGIGPKRAATLLRHFKTQKAMLEATAEQLAEAPGMSRKSAQAVYDFLRGDGAAAAPDKSEEGAL